MSRPPPRTTWVFLAIVLLAQSLLLVWHHGHSRTQPHEVPFVLQGPPIIAQSAADRLNRLPGGPVRALVVEREADARTSVRTGGAVAALIIDLNDPENALYVSSVNDPDTTRLAKTVAARVSKPMERDFTAHTLTPGDHADLDRVTAARVSGWWVASGFLVGLAWSLSRRRRRASPALDVKSSVGLGVACATLSLLGAAVMAVGHGSFGAWWLLGFLGTYAAAAATRALELLFGLVGLALASTLFLFLAGPLLSGRDPRLLPNPWWQLAPWTLHGAANQLTTSFFWFGSAGLLRPALVLAGTVILALLVVTIAPRLQRQSEEKVKAARVPWRLRMVVILVPVLLALVGATALAPSVASVVTAEPIAGADEIQCIATPKVSSVKELNDLVRKVRGGPAFQGADVGADVLLQDGRRLWVFADTLRAPTFEGQQFVRNSMLVFGQRCADAVLPADKGALIPDRGDGIGYWPMSIARVERPGYDIVGVATQRVRTTDAPDGIFAFESLGSSMAVFVVPRGKTPQLIAHEDIGKDDKNPARPEWGAAAAVHGGWVYLYGTARPQAKGIFGFSLRVARTRAESLLHSDTWQYWDGKRWQGSSARAAELIPSKDGVSQTLSVFTRNGRWYAVSKRNEVLGTQLVVWTAPSPMGPFDTGTTVAQLPSDPKSGELRYMPLAHPDLMPERSSVLVSYSRNNTDVRKVENDPFLYRPQFVRVTLPGAR